MTVLRALWLRGKRDPEWRAINKATTSARPIFNTIPENKATHISRDIYYAINKSTTSARYIYFAINKFTTSAS